MSSVARLMSAVRAGACDALPEGPGVEHAATSSAMRSTHACRIHQRIRASVGRSRHFRLCMLRAPIGGRRAEALVVDVLRDRRMLAADRALRIAAEAHLAEAALQRVVQKIPSDERIADPEKELDRLGGLHGADDSRQNAEHAGLGARRRQLRWRRLREEAAVARTLERLEHGDLTLEAEDRSMHHRDAVLDR